MLLKNIFFAIIILCFPSSLRSQVIAMPNAHAHNDYKHRHPLSDALNYGFTSIEADVFLKNDRFIVAHIFPFLKNHRSLEAIYLKPLSDMLLKHQGQIYSGYEEPVILLIDIKTNAEKTYKALKPLLEKYASMLSCFENGKLIKRAVIVILSGNKPYDLIANEAKRYAFIDENLMTLHNNNFNANYSPLASTKYSNLLTWNGSGKIPEIEKNELKKLVDLAHFQGKKVRLWGSPENKTVWKELLNAGVDLINSDDLEELNEFLLGGNGQNKK